MIASIPWNTQKIVVSFSTKSLQFNLWLLPISTIYRPTTSGIIRVVIGVVWRGEILTTITNPYVFTTTICNKRVSKYICNENFLLKFKKKDWKNLILSQSYEIRDCLYLAAMSLTRVLINTMKSIRTYTYTLFL